VAIPLQSEEVRSFHRSFDAHGIRALVMDIPVGEVEIEGSSSDRIEVDVTVECNWKKSRCLQIAEELDLVARDWDDELTLDVEGMRKWRSIAVHLEVQISAPASMSLELDMGVGEVEISDFRGDVTVDLGVGEVEVQMDESHVRSVDLDTGLGEVRMDYHGGRLEASGLFDNVLRWDEGAGSSKLRLETGVGEIDVRLR
jgi:hypothetical protein